MKSGLERRDVVVKGVSVIKGVHHSLLPADGAAENLGPTAFRKIKTEEREKEESKQDRTCTPGEG